MTIGERIKLVRGELSQNDFASKIGAGQRSIHSWEANYAAPGAKFLEAIHRVFKVDIHWLLTGAGDQYVEQDPAEKNAFRIEEPAREYKLGASTLGKAVEMLATVLNSGNHIFIQSLTSNLVAFSEAVKINAGRQQRIASLEAEVSALRDRLTALEKRSHEHPTTPPEPIKEQAM